MKYALIIGIICVPILFLWIDDIITFLMPVLVLLFNFTQGYLVITISKFIDK